MGLSTSEELFRLLSRLVPQAWLACDIHGNIHELNHAATTLLGYSREQLLNMNMVSLVWEEGIPRLKAEMEKTTTACVAPQVLKFQAGARQLVDLELRLHPFELNGHKTVMALLQDISERERAEDELHQSRWMLRAILDNIPQRVFWKDLSLTYLGCNQPFAIDAGLQDPADVVGKTDFDLIWRDTANLYRGDDERVMRSETAKLNFEEPQKRNDGTQLWLRTNKVPLRDHDGRVIGVIGCYEDITDQKRAEETLRKSEESFRLLFSAIPYPIFVYELHSFRFLEVNAAATATYGYSRDELLKMTVPDLLSPEERPRYIAEMRSGRIFNPKGKNWRCQAKDGRLLTTEVERHRFDFAGRSCILGFTQDVTQREQLEMELRQHQKLEAVGSLAAGVAHEINTPIQFVGDNLRFLQDAFESLHRVVEKSGQLRKAADAGSVPPELAAEFDATVQTADIEYLITEIPKAIHQSIEGAGRVATIVRAMKNFAHPDSGEMMNANLNEALTSTLTIARNELKYVADVEEDFGELPLVRCSLGDLNQVFLNLLVNAAHAIHEVVKDSGKKGKIRVATSAQPDWVQITIADSGCGIPKDIQDKVFDPFFTTKGVGRGTGQGLAIARAIVVEKHHGTLTFTTQEGEGTTFVMRLPHDQGSEVASSEDAASHE